MNVMGEEHFYLRKATEKDADLLFKWANDPEERQNSFHPESINYQTHIEWLAGKLESNECSIYILTNGNVDIGQCRVDIQGTDAMVSYFVEHSYRGLGYGKKMLFLLEETVKRDFPSLTKLVAEVKPENVASQRCFLDVGYSEKCFVYEFDLNTSWEPKTQGLDKKGGVLFLTNNANTLPLYDWLLEKIPICLWSDPIDVDLLKNVQPKLVVSFNYRYIIKQDCIDFMNGQILNLHISMLPWNRGSSPNIWSFIDDTPKGVTIHRVSAGLDEGDILLQKEVFLDPKQETFRTSYAKLINAVIDLFEQNFENLLGGTIEARKQGSYHTMADFKALQEQVQFSYDEKISDVLSRIRVK